MVETATALTTVLQCFGSMPLFRFPRDLMKVAAFVPFLVHWLICSLKLSFGSRIMLSHLVGWLAVIFWLLSVIVSGAGSLYFLVKKIASVFFGLNGEPRSSPFVRSSSYPVCTAWVTSVVLLS